jgi:hypothetical protein
MTFAFAVSGFVYSTKTSQSDARASAAEAEMRVVRRGS